MSSFSRFIARQPILDRKQRTVAYELLYRNGDLNRAVFKSQEFASLTTLDSSLMYGIDRLCNHNRAFINCSAELLVSDYILSVPPQVAVVEILESVEPAPQVVAACAQLKAAGYTIALDDFVPTPNTEPLLEFADILKIDIRATSTSERRALSTRFKKTHKLLAEKVESRAEFREALNAGFELFQGYYFQKPEILKTNEISASTVVYLQLFSAANRPEIDLPELEGLIKADPGLCYRLFRYLNSAIFGLKSSTTSICHCLALLGEREVRRWVSLTALVSVAAKSPDALTKSALLRAHLAGKLATRAGCSEYSAFVCGMFSVMDAILGIPLSEVLNRVQLPPEVTAALSNKSGKLYTLLRLIRAFEKGAWESVDKIAASLQIEAVVLAEAYAESVEWVDGILNLR